MNEFVKVVLRRFGVEVMDRGRLAASVDSIWTRRGRFASRCWRDATTQHTVVRDVYFDCRQRAGL